MLLGLSNLVMVAARVEVDGKRPNAVGTVLFCRDPARRRVGLWRVRYWAVLGFQALLALIARFTLVARRSRELLAVAAAASR